MDKELFSRRHGLKPQSAEITIRNDAPIELIEFLIQTVRSLGYEPDDIRDIVCRILKKMPDKKNNWSEPNVLAEVVDLLREGQWFYVYDAIEIFYTKIKSKHREEYETEVNDFFVMNGIGWKLEGGLVEFRGDENFEFEISGTITILESAGQNTAKTEMKEAIADLSRRPDPDITGAVQHSLACLECVAREVAGNDKMTLGELIKKHAHIVPRPLDEAISKVWGFTSEQGRHLREGGEPDFNEAELIVGLSAVLSSYLGRKLPKKLEIDTGY